MRSLKKKSYIKQDIISNKKKKKYDTSICDIVNVQLRHKIK
jgi:hypothetical protein